nr:MAG TPA: hypothetical protein [Inoviridae sp.]
MFSDCPKTCRAKAWSPVNHARSNSGIFIFCALFFVIGL